MRYWLLLSHEVATVLHNMEAKKGLPLASHHPHLLHFQAFKYSSPYYRIHIHYTIRFIYVFSFRDFKAHSLLMTKRDLQEGHSGNISMEKG